MKKSLKRISAMIFAVAEEAWQVFYGSLVADKFDTVNIRSFKTVWPEK